MSNNASHPHNNGNSAGSNGASSSTTNANGPIQNDHGLHHHPGGAHDPHGQPGVPLMHRTVDELLSAEFSLGIGNVQHSNGALNNEAQGNIMEGLDDLFGDDFSPVGTAAVNTNHANMAGLHMTSQQHPQSLPPNMQFSASHSPQNQLSPMHQHQQLQDQHRILQQQQAASALDSPSAVPAQLAGHPGSHHSQSPQISPAMAHVSQSRPQQASAAMAQQYQPQLAHQHFQSAGASRPIYQQQALNQQTPPRPGQPNIMQMSVIPNGQPATPSVSRPAMATAPGSLVPPAAAASIPIAQAGSPLHHILNAVSPAQAQQLTTLFALLQSNAVTPNEFLARAKILLDPAQFEILDGIRRRHGAARPSDGTPVQQQSPTASGSASIADALSPSAVANQATTPTLSVAAQSQARTGAAGIAGASIQAPGGGLGLPATTPGAAASSATNAASPVTAPSIASTSLPPTSGGSPQTAPVRKRNTDVTPSATPSESKVASKRLKTEHQLPGANGPTAQITTPAVPPSFPSTPGTNTPVSAASPGVFNRVSLPGQQRTPSTPMGAGGSGAGAGAGGAAGAGSRSAASGNIEKVNFDNLTDVMGYVGVDLKEESDNIMRDNDGYSKSGGGSDGLDRTRVQNFVNVNVLKVIVERIAKANKLENIEPDVLAYLAMATQERLRGLTEEMIHASKHRGRAVATAPPPMYDEDHPMYKVAVTQDVKKQLLAIERVEREEETKRKELIAERERRLAAGEDLDENGELRPGASAAGAGAAGGAKKGKKQKEGGPGVSARNMTEEARKKVANQTALGFAGGSGRSYSWMMGGGGGDGGAAGGAASPLPSVSTPGASSGAAGGAASAGSPSASGGVSVGAAGGGSVKPNLSRGATMPLSGSGSAMGMSLGTASTLGVSSPGGVSGTLQSSASSSALASPALSLTRGGSMILPPSTVGRPSGLLRDTARKVNIKDALFCLERDRGGGGGDGSGQRVLIKSYVKWLK